MTPCAREKERGAEQPTFCRDQRGFTGAEKALIICFALAIIALIGFLLSGGSEKAGSDARRALIERGGGDFKLGEVLKPIQAGGATQAPGQGGQPGQEQQPGDAQKTKSPWKVGTSGGTKYTNNAKQTQGQRSYKGAPQQTPEQQEKAAKKKGSKTDVEVGVEYKYLDKEGELKKWEGGGEKLSLGYGKLDGTAYAKASWQEGAAIGTKVEGKVSAVNWQGKHELPLGIQESHNVDVLSVKGSIDAKAGISKDMVGAKLGGEAAANIVEGKIEAKKVFKIPFTNLGIELGGTGSGSVGANIGGEASGGYFKGDDGKRRVGFKLGGKAALGLGLGFKVSLNLVW